MPILGVIASSVAKAGGVYESIASATPSGVSTVTFSGIPSTYTHLQIRMSMRDTGAGVPMAIQFNGDTATNYSWHRTYAVGSSASSNNTTSATQGYIGLAGINSPIFAGFITDIYDYQAPIFKTVKSLNGYFDAAATVYTSGLYSCQWRSTSAITSLRIFNISSSNFQTGSVVALYGIKAS